MPQIVGHAVCTGSSNTELVSNCVDIMTAVNSAVRSSVLEQVLNRVPSLGPYGAYAYGMPTKLYVDGAPAGSAPLLSSDGVRQGDPCAPMMFAMELQPVLEVASTMHLDCSIIANEYDISIQGPQQAVQCVFRHLRCCLCGCASF